MKSDDERETEDDGPEEKSSSVHHSAFRVPPSFSSSCQVGCQGWNYADWVTGPGERVFYPQGTRAADMLEEYARVFETVEVDSTFYAIPPATTFDGWARRTPPHFTFSLKLPQEITHERALGAGSLELLDEFCERARSILNEKLGAILIQLPPQFELTRENGLALRAFLPRLPRDLRFSIEFRSNAWLKQSVMDFLGEHHVALALVEGQWIAPEVTRNFSEHPTADFTYIRWMGARNLTRFDTVQRPQDENLRDWSETISRLTKRISKVYAYFSNYYEGHAPASANKLKRLLDQPTVEATDLEDQPSLF